MLGYSIDLKCSTLSRGVGVGIVLYSYKVVNCTWPRKNSLDIVEVANVHLNAEIFLISRMFRETLRIACALAPSGHPRDFFVGTSNTKLQAVISSRQKFGE